MFTNVNCVARLAEPIIAYIIRAIYARSSLAYSVFSAIPLVRRAFALRTHYPRRNFDAWAGVKPPENFSSPVSFQRLSLVKLSIVYVPTYNAPKRVENTNKNEL